MTTNNRDFIDFLIELIDRRKIFYLILIFCLGYATYFNQFKNNQITFETTLKIAPESVLIPLINNINVYNTSADVYLTPLRGNSSYPTLAEELCQLIRSTFVDEFFIDTLVLDFISKTPSVTLESKEEVFANLKNSIVKMASDATVCVNVKLTATSDYIVYLKQYYQSMVNKYLQQEMYARISIIRNGKIDFLQETLVSTKSSVLESQRAKVLGKLELNTLEERQLVVLSKLELVQNTPIADTSVRFIIYNSTDIGKTLNYIFLYAFAIFMSVIFYVLTIVLIEFTDQYKFRNSQKN